MKLAPVTSKLWFCMDWKRQWKGRRRKDDKNI